MRRGWVRRILVQDGRQVGEGGIEAWLRLGEAVGLSRGDLLGERLVLSGVRSAVAAYVRLARDEPWPVAVASSLTKLFAPDLMEERIRALERYYTWVPDWGLEYFRARLTQARVDSDEALELTLAHCTTSVLQGRAVAALEKKCGILWSMLDAIMTAYGAGPAPSPRPRRRRGPCGIPARRSTMKPVDGPSPPDPLARPRLAEGVRLQADRRGGGMVLLYPEGVLQLNRTGTEIPALCDGRRGIDEIVAVQAGTRVAPDGDLRADVLEFLGLLHVHQLVRFTTGFSYDE